MSVRKKISSSYPIPAKLKVNGDYVPCLIIGRMDGGRLLVSLKPFYLDEQQLSELRYSGGPCVFMKPLESEVDYDLLR